MFDCHIHSQFSLDCSETLEKIINKALEINLRGITITDHLEFLQNGKLENTNKYVLDSFEINKHISEINILKEKYKKQIDIFVGFEVGATMIKDAKFEVQKALNLKDVDFNILSTHQIEKHELSMGTNFFTNDKVGDYHKYFEYVLKSVKLYDNFSVYGHLDYITRYSKFKSNDIEIKYYKEIVDEILKCIVKKDCGLEVNTSGMFYGRDDFYPQKDILKRYKEIGGKIITIGSDAHTYKRVGENFDLAYDYLKDCGFKEGTYFVNKMPVFYKL